MYQSHSFHLTKKGTVDLKHSKAGNFYYVKIEDDHSLNDITFNFEDCEHLQDIITSLQEQLDEIKEKG